jgi:nucleotide-binding universal stress UspA family protein
LLLRSGAELGRRIVVTGGIFSSGRPVLLVPPEHQGLGSPAWIVIAWDASPASVRAVNGALPMFQRAQAVSIGTVTDDEEFRPSRSGIALAHLLARHGATASFHQVRRGGDSVAGAIADGAGEVQAGMLVMGAFRHGPVQRRKFGSATKTLLDAGATLPTLLPA